jgi:hypothetical protein
MHLKSGEGVGSEAGENFGAEKRAEKTLGRRREK